MQAVKYKYLGDLPTNAPLAVSPQLLESHMITYRYTAMDLISLFDKTILHELTHTIPEYTLDEAYSKAANMSRVLRYT